MAPRSDKDVSTWNSLSLLLRVQRVQSFWETVRRRLVKFNMYLPPDSAMSLLEIYTREMKTYCRLKDQYTNSYGSFIHNHQTLEATQTVLIGERINKIRIYTYNGILVSNEKELSLQAATWMILKSIMLSGRSTDIVRFYSYDVLSKAKL